jgi:hypothetical protein
MMKRQVLFILLMGIGGLLTACGSTSIQDVVRDRYTLIDSVRSTLNQDDISVIYEAEGQTLEEVRDSLRKVILPQKTSERVNDKIVMIFDDHFVTLTPSPENENNTYIEVATTGFVRENYTPSFFQGMFVMWLLDDILDVDDWGKRQKSRCIAGDCYKGYKQSGGRYKGPAAPPLIRGSSVRGGGPGTGK